MMELSRELDEQFDRLVNECRVSGEINQELYTEYDVKRGLRDANGKGVLTGLTEDGRLMINDPNSITRSEKRWDIDTIVGQVKSAWTYTVP